jgi:hypothetical protein
MPPEPEDRSLEDLLDAAGRSAQPTHPGWQQLPQRLARLPQRLRRLRWRWWLAGGAAVAAAALVVIALLFPPNAAVLAGPIEVQRLDVQLTILSVKETEGETLFMPLLRVVGQSLSGVPDAEPMAALSKQVVPPGPPLGKVTGQALVKDHRLVLNLRDGDNEVRFTDVAASMDPTSVRFVSTTDPEGTQVVEQNFEYDLASADTLLQRYLEREITCIGRDGQETTGYLIAHDPDSIVLATEPPGADGKKRTTQTLSRATLQAVRLHEMPAGLLVKPTLVWKLRTHRPGRHDTLLTYLCGMMKWQADYIALVTPGDDLNPERLDLTGWVSIENTSGSTYEKAQLKLIAGDVNRKRDPWAPEPPQGVALATFGAIDGPVGAVTNGPLVKKEFVEQSFFEYHLYTLTAPSTVRDREGKQLNLLQRKGVQANRRYVYDPYVDGRRASIELAARNEKENQLGLPLPKGRVTFEQRDTDGETAVLGHVDIDHTAVKEELVLRYGHAFDVIGEFKEVQLRQYEMRVRNHKTQTIRVRAVAHTAPGQKVLLASHGYELHDAQTVWFDFDLKPNAEQQITYTLSKNPQEP